MMRFPAALATQYYRDIRSLFRAVKTALEQSLDADVAPVVAAMLAERDAIKPLARADAEALVGENGVWRGDSLMLGRSLDQALMKLKITMERAADEAKVKAVAAKFAETMSRQHLTQLEGAVKTMTATKQYVGSPGLSIIGTTTATGRALTQDVVNGYIASNVGLIKSIPEELHGQVRTLVYQHVTGGRPMTELKGQIMGLFPVKQSRAELIARDQAGKLYGDLTHVRMTDAGLKTFIWKTVGDDRVRDSHRELDGKEFTWEEGAPVNGKFPGKDYQCRCIALPNKKELLERGAGPVVKVPKPKPPAPKPPATPKPKPVSKLIPQFPKGPTEPVAPMVKPEPPARLDLRQFKGKPWTEQSRDKVIEYLEENAKYVDDKLAWLEAQATLDGAEWEAFYNEVYYNTDGRFNLYRLLDEARLSGAPSEMQQDFEALRQSTSEAAKRLNMVSGTRRTMETRVPHAFEWASRDARSKIPSREQIAVVEDKWAFMRPQERDAYRAATNVRDWTLDACRDTKDVERWLKARGCAAQADFSGMDLNCAKAVAASLDDTCDMIPGFQLGHVGTRKGLVNISPSNRKFAMTYEAGEERVWGFADIHQDKGASPFGMRVCFDEGDRHFSNFGQLIEDAKRAEASGFHVKGSGDPQAIGHHEFGHSLHGLTRQRMEDAAVLEKLKTGAGETLEDVFVRARNSGRLSREVSKYATENFFEFVAETWTAYLYQPEMTPLVKEVGPVLARAFGKALNGNETINVVTRTGRNLARAAKGSLARMVGI